MKLRIVFEQFKVGYVNNNLSGGVSMSLEIALSHTNRGSPPMEKEAICLS